MALKQKKTHKKHKCTKYKTHRKSTLETLKKSEKVDLVNSALETGEGTKIN